MRDNEQLRKQWNATAKKALVGRKIVKAWYPTQKELEEGHLPGSGVMFELDNGAVWMPFQDDEGNGPGALVVVEATMSLSDYEAYPKHLPTL